MFLGFDARLLSGGRALLRIQMGTLPFYLNPMLRLQRVTLRLE